MVLHGSVGSKLYLVFARDDLGAVDEPCYLDSQWSYTECNVVGYTEGQIDIYQPETDVASERYPLIYQRSSFHCSCRFCLAVAQKRGR